MMRTVTPEAKPSGQMTRRGCIRGAAAASLVLGGAILDGCASAKTAATPPTLASARTTIVFNTALTYSGLKNDQALALVDQLLQPFYQQNPSIQVKMALTFDLTSNGGLITQSAAGTMADVFHTWAPPTPQLEQGILLDLMPYAKQDNLDLSIFSTQQLSQLQTGGGLYGLPMYLGTMVVIANLGLLDGLGIPYPSAGWTYADWAEIARAATAKGAGAKARYGIDNIGMPADAWQYRAFGGSIVDPADPSRCTLDAPGCVAAVQWYTDLLQAGVANGRDLFFTGQAATRIFPEWELDFWLATLYKAGLKWKLYPLPSHAGLPPTTYATSDYYGVAGASKHPKEAWELIRFLATDPGFSEGLMKTRLLAPALKSLWPQFVSIVNSVAPFTHNADIASFGTLALTDQAIPDPVFPYATAQAENVFGAALQNIQAGKVDAQGGLRAAALQINALQQAGKVEATAATVANAAFPTAGPRVATVVPGL